MPSTILPTVSPCCDLLRAGPIPSKFLIFLYIPYSPPCSSPHGPCGLSCPPKSKPPLSDSPCRINPFHYLQHTPNQLHLLHRFPNFPHYMIPASPLQRDSALIAAPVATALIPTGSQVSWNAARYERLGYSSPSKNIPTGAAFSGTTWQAVTRWLSWKMRELRRPWLEDKRVICSCREGRSETNF